MSRNLIIGAAAIATAAGISIPSASAQVAVYNTDEYGVVVIAPPRAREVPDPSNRGVHPRMELVSQALVYTADLDLNTERGRDILDERVEAAAEQACEWLDEVYPPTGPGAQVPDNDCELQAVKDAREQVRIAIASD